MGDALRKLSEWVKSTSFNFSGHSGHSIEKSDLFRDHNASALDHAGHGTDPVVTTVTKLEDALVTPKSLKSLVVTGVTVVTTENDEGGIAAPFAAEPEPPDKSGKWGLSRYTIRNFARWYEDEANRRRDGIELRSTAICGHAWPNTVCRRNPLLPSLSASCGWCSPSRHRTPHR